MQKLKLYLQNYKVIFAIYVLVTIIASVQSYLQGPKDFGDGIINTHYNNYVIFKQSFFHLLNHSDLYSLYPDQHWDYYKYSPAFALFMGSLAYLPDVIGLSFWNLLNSLVIFIALRSVPNIKDNNKIFMLWFVLLELLTSMQSEQSNGLMAGLMILAFNKLEAKQILWASLFITLTVFIKLFGLVAFALFLLYPGRLKFILYSLFWITVLTLVPFIIIPLEHFEFLYGSWLELLANDHSASVGISVMGWLYTWFGINISKNIILLAGVVLFCIPLLKINEYKKFGFRLLMLASVLLWVIIFNHKAESPTFIIAICGVALWYFPQLRKTENLVLLVLALLFTSISVTDLCPRYIRKEIFEPYLVKGVPCILIWFKLIYDLTFSKYSIEE